MVVTHTGSEVDPDQDVAPLILGLRAAPHRLDRHRNRHHDFANRRGDRLVDQSRYRQIIVAVLAQVADMGRRRLVERCENCRAAARAS